MFSLTLSVAIALGAVPQDTSKIDLRAAAVAVLDSGEVWAGDVVRKATRVAVDRASFVLAARDAGVSFVAPGRGLGEIRPGAEDKSFDVTKVCVGTIQQRCTLPEKTVALVATKVRVAGEQTTVTIALRWPYRNLIGFVEYDVTFVGGVIASVRQTRRS